MFEPFAVHLRGVSATARQVTSLQHVPQPSASSSRAREPDREAHDAIARPRAPGSLLGIGLGGLIDGIVLHQILQRHHMLTSQGSYPKTTVAGLETNTLWDGLFQRGRLARGRGRDLHPLAPHIRLALGGQRTCPARLDARRLGTL